MPSKSDTQKRKENRFWAVATIFDMAEAKGLNSPGFEPFSKLILEKTGTRIPAGTLTYWYNGHSTPKIDEVELMANAFGMELDLMDKE